MEKKNILSYLNTPVKRIIAFVLAAILAFVPLHNLEKRMNSKADGEINLTFTTGVYTRSDGGNNSYYLMYDSIGSTLVDTIHCNNGILESDIKCYLDLNNGSGEELKFSKSAGESINNDISGTSAATDKINIIIKKATTNELLASAVIDVDNTAPVNTAGFKLNFKENKEGTPVSGSYTSTGDTLSDVLIDNRSAFEIDLNGYFSDSETDIGKIQFYNNSTSAWEDLADVKQSVILSVGNNTFLYRAVNNVGKPGDTKTITIKAVAPSSDWNSQTPMINVKGSSLDADVYVKSGDTVKVTYEKGIPYWISKVELSNGSETLENTSVATSEASLFNRNITDATFTIGTEEKTYTKVNLSYYDPTASGIITITKDIGHSIIVDNTLPEIKDFKIVYHDNSVVVEDLDEAKWYDGNIYDAQFTVEEANIYQDITKSYFKNGDNSQSIRDTSTIQYYPCHMPESKDKDGTLLIVHLEDKSGNIAHAEKKIKIDSTNPKLVNSSDWNKTQTVGVGHEVAATITDNLSLESIKVKVNEEVKATLSPDLERASEGSGDVSVPFSATLDSLVGGKLENGKTYTVSIEATDKAGHTLGTVYENKYTFDANQFEISASNSVGEYTDTAYNVTIKANKNVDKIKTADTKVKIYKDGALYKEISDLALSNSGTGSVATINIPLSYGDGKYQVEVQGYDYLYNSSREDANVHSYKTTSSAVIIDTKAPTITMSGVENNGKYDAAKTVTYSVTDTNKDETKNTITVDFTTPDGTKSTETVSGLTRTFTADGTYTVTMTATDKAGHSTTSDPVTFRVDKTDPVANITNAVKKGRKATPTLSITEAFKDATGKYTVYYSAPETTSEQALAPVAVTQGADINLVFGEGASNANFAKDGTYRIVFEVEDAVGRKSSAETSFIIDATAPVITLLDSNGVKIAGAASKNPITLNASVFEEFFSDVTITVKGTREDINGNKATLSFDPKKATSKTTNISETFEIDGRYNVEIIATDSTGNTKSSGALMFTIDKTAPVLDTSSLDKYENAYLNNLDFAKVNVNSLVKDLTLKTTSITLNGKEFTGDATDYEDGSYILKISAEDELGNTSEKEIHFILDTKAPVFLVTGVEDGQIQKDSYDITIALQLNEDTLVSVFLNGEEIAIKNNTATFSVKDDGTYELVMKAVDRAGNESEQKISFGIGSEEEIVLDTYGTDEGTTTEAVADEILEEKEKVTTVNTAIDNANNYWWIWIAAVAGVLVLFFAGYFIVAKKKGGKDTPEE